jgi:hypoxanthine-DNA glycosylase
MANCVGFKAVSRKNAQVLILGTLPGVESLKQHQYYAKRQNSFWKIMGELVGAFPDLPYEDRLACLTENNIALWDVCKAAERKGSLDSDIQFPRPNNFDSFFTAHQDIALICFNGQPARKMFCRYVQPDVSGRNFDLCVLPSTSPAYAGMRYEQKLSRWREALKGHLNSKIIKTNAQNLQ